MSNKKEANNCCRNEEYYCCNMEQFSILRYYLYTPLIFLDTFYSSFRFSCLSIITIILSILFFTEYILSYDGLTCDQLFIINNPECSTKIWIPTQQSNVMSIMESYSNDIPYQDSILSYSDIIFNRTDNNDAMATVTPTNSRWQWQQINEVLSQNNIENTQIRLWDLLGTLLLELSNSPYHTPLVLLPLALFITTNTTVGVLRTTKYCDIYNGVRHECLDINGNKYSLPSQCNIHTWDGNRIFCNINSQFYDQCIQCQCLYSALKQCKTIGDNSDIEGTSKLLITYLYYSLITLRQIVGYMFCITITMMFFYRLCCKIEKNEENSNDIKGKRCIKMTNKIAYYFNDILLIKKEFWNEPEIIIEYMDTKNDSENGKIKIRKIRYKKLYDLIRINFRPIFITITSGTIITMLLFIANMWVWGVYLHNFINDVNNNADWVNTKYKWFYWISYIEKCILFMLFGVVVLRSCYLVQVNFINDVIKVYNYYKHIGGADQLESDLKVLEYIFMYHCVVYSLVFVCYLEIKW